MLLFGETQSLEHYFCIESFEQITLCNYSLSFPVHTCYCTNRLMSCFTKIFPHLNIGRSLSLSVRHTHTHTSFLSFWSVLTWWTFLAADTNPKDCYSLSLFALCGDLYTSVITFLLPQLDSSHKTCLIIRVSLNQISVIIDLCWICVTRVKY